jgi:hypothetical protein
VIVGLNLTSAKIMETTLSLGTAQRSQTRRTSLRLRE